MTRAFASLAMIFVSGALGCSNRAPESLATAATPSSRAGTVAFSRAKLPVAGAVPFVARDAGFLSSGAKTLDVTAALSATGTQHLAVRSLRGFELDLSPLDVRSVEGALEDGAVVYQDAALDTDVILTASPNGFEEVRVLRSAAAPTVARWRVRTGAAVASIRVREGRVEALDAAGVVRLSAAPMLAVDAVGTHRLAQARLEGDVLVASLDVTGLTFPIALDPGWSTVPAMANRRNYAAAAVQANGTVFVVGGHDGTADVSFPEEFDPTTNTWSTRANLVGANQNNEAATIAGSVLVTGFGDGKQGAQYFLSSKAWFNGPDLTNARSTKHVIVPLSTSSALVFGSFTPNAELFSSAGGGSFTAAGALASSRVGVAGAKLPDGRVIAIGGSVSPAIFATAVSVNTTEIWSPTTKTWSAGPNLLNKREGSRVVTLPSGALLVVGGWDSNAPAHKLSSCELWDPTTKTFKATGALTTARDGHTATLLQNGKVLVVGGFGSTGTLSTAEIWDPATGNWSSAGSLATRRGAHVAAALGDGRVLVAGGTDSSTSLSTAEIFSQAADGGACTAGFECNSGNCVDKTCCGSAACAADETCATGKCQKKSDVSCTADGECSTGHCVDGVCCDTACTGQCQACDVSGLRGKCSPVLGAPHGTRAACTGDLVGGECGLQCDGTETSKCNYLGASVNCGTRGCKDGTESTVGVCDGSGRCGATPKSCAGYACGGDTCKTSCASDTDCLSTHQCVAGKCTARGATCSSDGASVVEPGGKTTNCAPFACKAGACVETCAVSTDCISGNLCDSNGKCVPPPSDTTDEGGCAVSHRGRSGAAFAFLAFAALARARRRRA